MHAIVVHGGAINPLDETFNRGVKEAVMEGFGILEKGGSALDAVTRTIANMEDNPIFNAGTGSWLNLAGEVEMDAIIVDGAAQTSGAVAGVRKVKNPILVARKVMEETDHILLAGEGATKFARAMGFPEYNPVTKEREQTWKEMKAKLMRGEQLSMTKYWTKISKFASSDTVGCVALDKAGKMAAGTSSGGFPFKLPGRVGDVPVINAATFASNECGVSLTGHGEIVMHNIIARRVHDSVVDGAKPQKAIETTFRNVLLGLKSREGVLMAGIVLNKEGEVGMARNVDLTPHAFMSARLKEPMVGFSPKMKI
jgi:beta-aspartyl-peptidase (threonine type)